jgi:hypothetical protein
MSMGAAQSYEERLSFPMSELPHRDIPTCWEDVFAWDQGTIHPRQVSDFKVSDFKVSDFTGSSETVSWSMRLFEPSIV